MAFKKPQNIQEIKIVNPVKIANKENEELMKQINHVKIPSIRELKTKILQDST